MRLGRLKFEMAMTPGPKKHIKQSGFIRVTKQPWVDEWRASMNDKNVQRFNGKMMFDPLKGEMSSSQVRKLLGWTKNKFMYYVYNQEIKFTQKGYYYIFYKEDVDAFIKKVTPEQKEEDEISWG